MIHIKSVLERVTPFGAAATLLIAAIVPVLSAQMASAQALVDRSLMVTSSTPSDQNTDANGTTVTTPGSPYNGANVGHTYTFKAQTIGSIQSLELSYCDTPFGYLDVQVTPSYVACDVPAGFSADNVTTATVEVNGSGAQTFTVSTSEDGFLRLTATNPVTTAADTDVITVEFAPTVGNYFINPDSSYIGNGANQHPTGTYFAHIKTFSDAAWATFVDEGTMTNNITSSINITTRVQETLNFSVEGDETQNGPSSTYAGAGNPCTPLNPTANTPSLTMGDSNDALAPDTAYDARSYFRLATNSSNGAVVYYSGDTLKSGGNSIAALAAKDTSTAGEEQFGLAIDASASDFQGGNGLVAESDYADGAGAINTPAAAQFAFQTGSLSDPEPIATSTGVVVCDTGAVRYVANISTDTPAGIYTTKINYIASPSY